MFKVVRIEAFREKAILQILDHTEKDLKVTNVLAYFCRSINDEEKIDGTNYRLRSAARNQESIL